MGHELGARFAGEVGSVACVAGARRRVLDIGCGGGANLAQFLKLCPQGSVCGIDFSAESVATSLRKNAGAVAAGRCEVRQGDVSRLPYADASFDLVTAFETVYFWPDVPPPLQRCTAYSDRPACF